MTRQPWCFQCDIEYGDTDPIVKVFMGEVETDDETGVTSIRQDTRYPVEIPMSKLTSIAELMDNNVMAKRDTDAKAARIKKREDEAIAASQVVVDTDSVAARQAAAYAAAKEAENNK